MKKAFATAVVLCIGSASMAQAQDYNFDVFVGGSASNDLMWDGSDYETNSGTVLGLGLSRNNVFVPGLEIGLEFSTDEQEYTSFEPNSIGADTLLITARYNFFESGGFEGYAGLGLGAAKVTYVAPPLYEDSETVGVGQIMLGGRYNVAPASQVFVEYRYLKAADAQVASLGLLGATGDAEFSSSNIVLGYRYSF
jgi:opacity protein-like surface antigen